MADRDRPLAPAGLRQAEIIARHLKDSSFPIRLVLCSSSVRTRQTIEVVARGMTPAPEILFEDELYGASATELAARIGRLKPAADSVMLVGHNPGMHELAIALVKPGPARARLEDRFPTGALATLAVAVDSWAAVKAGSADLVDLTIP